MANEPVAKEAPTEPKPESVAWINVPTFYSDSLRAFSSGNDFALMFMQLRFGTTGEGQMAASAETVATVRMSPKTAKDLFLLMRGEIEKYEREWGEIDTPYKRRLAAGR